MRRSLAIGAAFALWAAVAHAQTPTVQTFAGVANATSGGTSYATSITPTTNTAATAGLVLKNSPGVFYRARASNAVAGGFLVLLNAAAIPNGGAAIVPLDCVIIAANGTASIDYSPGPGATMSTEIVIGLTTTAAGCFTFTTTSGFLSGMVQ